MLMGRVKMTAECSCSNNAWLLLLTLLSAIRSIVHCGCPRRRIEYRLHELNIARHLIMNGANSNKNVHFALFFFSLFSFVQSKSSFSLGVVCYVFEGMPMTLFIDCERVVEMSMQNILCSHSAIHFPLFCCSFFHHHFRRWYECRALSWCTKKNGSIPMQQKHGPSWKRESILRTGRIPRIDSKGIRYVCAHTWIQQSNTFVINATSYLCRDALQNNWISICQNLWRKTLRIRPLVATLNRSISCDNSSFSYEFITFRFSICHTNGCNRMRAAQVCAHHCESIRICDMGSLI